MTPKEKAQELIKVFKSVELAIRCVDEILDAVSSFEYNASKCWFWEQVNIELEKSTNPNLDFLTNQAQDLNLGY